MPTFVIQKVINIVIGMRGRCKTLFDGNRGAMWEEFRDLRDRMKRAKANTVRARRAGTLCSGCDNENGHLNVVASDWHNCAAGGGRDAGRPCDRAPRGLAAGGCKCDRASQAAPAHGGG